MKKILFIALFATYLTLTGCASSGPIILGNEKISQAEAFQKGLIRLDCVFTCSGKLGANLVEIDALLYARAWDELARRVMGIGYGGELTYYYLGRAAEGLNYLPAAKTYYQLGLSAQAKCKVMGVSNCQGHNFPNDINKHLADIEGK